MFHLSSVSHHATPILNLKTADPFFQVSSEVYLYVLRLLNDLLGTIPCRFNPAQMCENIVSFRFRATTPAR
eukprot:s685_g17.t1